MAFILIVSLSAGVLSQAIKLLIKVIKSKSFNWHLLDSYGGMPSSHSAFLLSLMTSVGMIEGFSSTAFAITFVLSTIIIRDAFGLRMIMEEQGKLVVTLINGSPDRDKILNGSREHSTVGHRVGHTIPEVIVGSIIGILFSIASYYLFYSAL